MEAKMPFRSAIKADMFVKCARLCCLCLKQCGTKIEAAHIVPEAEGGANDADNGIPLCFDCHQEVGGYNVAHPRGNKFTPGELRGQRDRVYALVASGVMHASIVAARARAASVSRPVPIQDLGPPTQLEGDAKRFLARLLRSGDPPSSVASKLELFRESERAMIIDRLAQKASASARAIEALARILSGDSLPEEQAAAIVEHLLRGVSLFGDIDERVAVLRHISSEIMALASETVRTAFFEELIEIVDRNQFAEVNSLVPALVGQTESVPSELHARFVLSLLDAARSDAWYGAPAAARLLRSLPERMARAGIRQIDAEYLVLRSRDDHVMDFVRRYARLEKRKRRSRIFDDFASLSRRDFAEKYDND